MIACLLSLSLANAADFQITPWRADAGVVHSWWIPDLAITGASVGGLVWMYGLGPRDPGGVAEMHGIDVPPSPRWSPAAAAASDFFGHAGKYYGANLPVLGTLGAGVYGGLRQQSVGAGAVWTLVMMESVGVDLLVTEVLKDTISRPRPYTSLAFQQALPEVYASDTIQHELSEEGHYDAYKSFPSGHTSSTGSVTFSLATLIWQDLRSRGARPGVAGALYGGAAALTATTGTLRVIAGYHHPTDVIAGGLLGAGVGTGVALLHTRVGSRGVATSVSMSEDAAPTLTFSGVW